jgi:hypothetical protein
MTIDEIILNLQSLKLDDEPSNEVRDLFKQVGRVAYMLVTFHKGKSIMRARPNEIGQRFSHKDELSFKPQKFNTTYQRASTPNQTMFYATSLPERIEAGELENARIIGVVEAMPWLRDKTSSGYKKITFGRWHVEEDINLIAIIHKDTFYEESNYTRELVDAYNHFIGQEDKQMVDKSLKYQRFLADEFSKDITKHTDYLISAIFTEIVSQNPNIDGVLYPSVRVLGKGFNVAIKPESCAKLGLYVTGECSVYKLKDHTVVGNDSIVKLDGKTDTFIFEDIENHRTECLQQLGVKSIDELK